MRCTCYYGEIKQAKKYHASGLLTADELHLRIELVKLKQKQQKEFDTLLKEQRSDRCRMQEKHMREKNQLK